MRFFALGYVMESHTINKGEREQKFLEIKENKCYILNPMGVCGFHGVFAIVLVVLLVGCIRLGHADCILIHSTGVSN